MKKKFLALTMAAMMLMGLVACGGEAPAAEEGKYTVGICQLAQHPALDAATQGFMDELEKQLGAENIDWQLQNASNDPNTCNTIVNSFVSNNVDLIMANATPAVQAASAATGTIPVLGTAVTEYGVALGIENFTGLVGTNVSGTSDLAPLDQQAAMIRQWCPDAKTVGLLYCSAEANSLYQVKTIRTMLEEDGFTCTEFAFTDSNDIAAVVQAAADASDVLYVPTDNSAANNTGIIDGICHGKVPVFAGEAGICKGCGVATLSISYYDLGVATGQMAAQILKGESQVSQMPISYVETITPMYNAANCEALGLTAPADYVAID